MGPRRSRTAGRQRRRLAPADRGGRCPLRLTRRTLLARTAAVTAGSVAGGLALNAAAPLLLPAPTPIDVNASYWSRALPAAEPALGRSTDADVVVIGGGLTGLSAAYYLAIAQPGRRVALLEARRCGNGASARNGAMLLTSTADRALRAGADPQLDRRVYDLTVGNIDALRALSVAHATDIELECSGALQVLNTPAQLRDALLTASRLRAAGLPIECWDFERTRASLGTAHYAGALFDPRSGQLHPGKLVGLFKQAARRAGVAIFEATPVVSIEEGLVHSLVTAAGYRVRTPLVVLATNAYSARLGQLRTAYAPIIEHVAITAPLTAAQLDAAQWRSRLPFSDSRLQVYYLGLTADHRIHIGGGPAGYAFNGGSPSGPVPERHLAALRAELARIFPALGQLPFECAWSGLVDSTLDEAPAVGRTGRYGNLYYAIGFSGHGVNLTSVFGRIIADLIGGRDADWRWLPYVNRLPPYVPNEPFRWLGIRATLAASAAYEQ